MTLAARLTSTDRLVEELRRELEAARADAAELELEVRRARGAAVAAALTAQTALERLEQAAPVVKAARSLLRSYEDQDDAAGIRATEDLVRAVVALPPEPS